MSRKKTLNYKPPNKTLDNQVLHLPHIIQETLNHLYLSGGHLLVQNIIDKKVPAYNALFVNEVSESALL
jgi:hypothetical protein